LITADLKITAIGFDAIEVTGIQTPTQTDGGWMRSRISACIMKRKLLVVSLLVAALIAAFSVALTMADQNKGAANIKINAGKKGNVPFPHRQHQDRLDDCKICHSVFPQKSGSIAELKAAGKLKKKYVMNKLCTKCHKEKKRAGQKSGPTKCTTCHIKIK
jgi:hypothetical protein